MSHCVIFAFGSLRIELDGRPLTTSRHKALALLVYLAIKKESCRREELAALFWPEFESASAFAYLRRALWEIKTMLGEGWLKVNRAEIGIDPQAGIWLDVSEFRRQVASLASHPHPNNETCPQCVDSLRAALELPRGDFLAGFSLRDSPAFDDWQFFQSEQLRREVAGALKRLVTALKGNGSYEIAQEYANRWLALDPLNEESHRQIMRLFALQGERNSALRQFQKCERILQNELGESPEKETIRLYQQIQAGTTVLEPGIPPNREQITSSAIPLGSTLSWLDQALSSPARTPVPRNFPPLPTPFVGRRDELIKISQMLADPTCWLLTLLGPGGIGKTRLAIQSAQALIDTFSQGIYFVPLVSAESSLTINSAIAKSLELDFRPAGPSPEQQVCNYLCDKNILLVLDSFEHLVASAGLLQQIHAQAATVKFLVTSRHRLQLQGESVLNVRGMKHPAGVPKTIEEIKAYSAVELFLQTARRVQADFQANEADLSAITRLARLLDGVPLGLELAANWVKMLSCEDIVVEISHDPDFLDSPLRDFPAKHRSLRAVFEQSWKLLNPREQRLFPRLSVFRGGFSYHAAEQVAGISLQELAELTDKSLVQRASGGRFVLHELVRQYGNERLRRSPTEHTETYDRYCQYFCQCLNQWGVQLKSPQQGRALKELEADLGNALSAWEWALDHCQVDRLESAIAGLCPYFLRSMRYPDGREACKKAATALMTIASPPARKLRSRLLAWQAAFCLNLEQLDETGLLLEESQVILDGFSPEEVQPEKALLCLVRMVHDFLLGQPEQAADYYEQSLILAQGSTGQMVPSILFFWKLLMNAGVFSPRLWSQIERTLPYKRQTGDIFETACLLQTLGVIAGYHNNDLVKMAGMLGESITLFQQLDDPISQSLNLDSLNTMLNIRGQFSELLTIRQKKLAVALDLGDRRMIGYAQAEVGETLCHLGNYEQAEAYLQNGVATLKTSHSYEHALWQQHLANVLLAHRRYQEAVELCRSSLAYFHSVGEMGWESTTLASLSHAEFSLGKSVEAWKHALESLHLLTKTRAFAFFIPRSLAMLALLYVDRGNIDMANEIQAQISLQPFWANSRWYADLYGDPIRNAGAGLLLPEGTPAIRIRSAKDLCEIAMILLETENKR